MKDFDHCFHIVVNFPDWMYQFTSPNEWIAPLTESERLWFALFCFEAKNQGE